MAFDYWFKNKVAEIIVMDIKAEGLKKTKPKVNLKVKVVVDFLYAVFKFYVKLHFTLNFLFWEHFKVGIFF